MSMKWTAKICARLLYVLLLIVLVETSAFIFGQFKSEMFSYRHKYVSKLSESELSYDAFRKSPSFSALTGWQTAPNTFDKVERNCLRKLVSENILNDGRRKSLTDDSGAEAQLAVFGDSFVYGDELNDVDTISSQLYKTYSIPAYNYGVPGFGPAQTLLRIKEKMAQRPEIKMVVFGIGFETIRRMVNSYRPVYKRNTEVKIALKPFVKDGKVVPLPTIEQNLDFFRHVNSAFLNDYWRLPDRKFPYSVSLAKAIVTETFKRKAHERIRRLFGRQPHSYAYDYADEYLTTNLGFVIEQFDKWAREASKDGLVLFMPRNHKDLSSPQKFVREVARTIEVDVRIVRGAQNEWEHYNLKKNGGCHPSPFGAGMIAREIAGWASTRRKAALRNSSQGFPARNAYH